ncbi:MAG: serine/threonine protein kinase [Actinobacteria bacterium]|nr:serine/threonine protein kinase [Actinomycetota bacterium]
MTEDVAAPAPPQPGQPGWMLGGRYQVVDRIGTGGMAEVFRAHDQLLARDVAVKVFRTHTDPDEVTGGVQRHELELQTLARLSHPNLITLFDGSVGADGEPAFLVMELIHGPSLAARIAQSPLPEPEVREIAAQLAAALSYVHSQNMVHRDIKPANILLGSDGILLGSDALSGDVSGGSVRARLSDFGIVRLLGSEHLTSADLMVGTASYLAPEQARGAEVGPAADVYALGLVLIEALTGKRSYEGPALEAVLARLERAPEIPADLPQPWPGLLLAMTAMNPDQRPSAAEVARMLRETVPAAVLPVAGAGAVLAGEAVLAGGAPLAAAAGVAGAAGLAGAGAAGLAGAGLAGEVGPELSNTGWSPAAVPPAAGLAAAGFAGPGTGPMAAGFTGAPPADLATAFIATGVPPMPPPAEHEPMPATGASDDSLTRVAKASRGPLVGALVAAAALIAALTAGGLMLVHGPSSDGSTNLPGQAVSSTSSNRPPAKATPTRSSVSVAPIGSVPTQQAGGTSSSAPRTSSSAPSSSTPASSSARPSTSAPATTSAPPSSSAPTTSTSPSSSGSATPSGSQSTTTSGAPAGSGTGTGTPTTPAAPAAGSGTGSATAPSPRQIG